MYFLHKLLFQSTYMSWARLEVTIFLGSFNTWGYFRASTVGWMWLVEGGRIEKPFYVMRTYTCNNSDSQMFRN